MNKKEKEITFTADNWTGVSAFLKPICDKKGVRYNITSRLVDEMMLTFDMIFWTFKEVKTFEYPKTWWDAFKLRVFPLWLLTLFPVKMTQIVIKEVVSQLPKKYNSVLYNYKEEISCPKIILEDPKEYDFTFEKFDKIEE